MNKYEKYEWSVFFLSPENCHDFPRTLNNKKKPTARHISSTIQEN